MHLILTNVAVKSCIYALSILKDSDLLKRFIYI